MSVGATTASDLNAFQHGLSQLDVTALCDTAARAWVGKAGRRVTFWWRGRFYRSRLTTFRMLIDTLDGEPVACVWR